jgi:uncharacterized membrane protein
MNRLKHHWDNLRASFWFLPALIVVFSALLAFGLIETDYSAGQDLMDDWPRLFGASAGGRPRGAGDHRRVHDDGGGGSRSR